MLRRGNQSTLHLSVAQCGWPTVNDCIDRNSSKFRSKVEGNYLVDQSGSVTQSNPYIISLNSSIGLV